MPTNRANPSEACPPTSILKAFTVGDLPTEALEAVAIHASLCACCQSMLDNMEHADDSLILNLRRYVSAEDPEPRERAFSLGLSTLPSKFGPYQLEEWVGEGTIGTVFKAQQVILSRVVAIRVSSRAAIGRSGIHRLRSEVAAVSRLQHPNIVQIYECGKQEGWLYVAMEFMDGGNLSARLRGGPLPVREAVELVRVLALTVQYAHRHRILHRQLKPGHVLLGSSGVAKLTGFVLAEEQSSTKERVWPEAFLDSLPYMPPEQVYGDRQNVGPTVDVYAMGAILYECLLGRPPLWAGTPIPTKDVIRTTEPGSSSGQFRGVNRDLEAICRKCLEKSPQHRYPTAQALADDLDRWLRGERTVVHPEGYVARILRKIRRCWRGGITTVLLACHQ